MAAEWHGATVKIHPGTTVHVWLMQLAASAASSSIEYDTIRAGRM